MHTLWSEPPVTKRKPLGCTSTLKMGMFECDTQCIMPDFIINIPQFKINNLKTIVEFNITCKITNYSGQKFLAMQGNGWKKWASTC